jgi:hypothetical protein
MQLKMKKWRNDPNRPLEDGETLKITNGCKRLNAHIFRNHSVLNICAFVRAENVCLSPPKCRKNMYKLLREKISPEV